MSVRLIVVPYYLGHHNVGMGAGPMALLEDGADRLVAGADMLLSMIRLQKSTSHEIGDAFAVNRLLSGAVADAVRRSEFPLVLAGNCNQALGVLAGIGGACGVVWLDAHGDFHTPETTSSGFFDGFPLGMVVGDCWTKMTNSLDGFTPVPQEHVILAGVRELDEGEEERVAASSLAVCRWTDDHGFDRTDFARALDRVCEVTDGVYVHIDLDVIDRDIAPANPYSPPGGLALDVVEELIGMIASRGTLRAATLACYDPVCDPTGAARGVGLKVLGWLAEAGAGTT